MRFVPRKEPRPVDSFFSVRPFSSAPSGPSARAARDLHVARGNVDAPRSRRLATERERSIIPEGGRNSFSAYPEWSRAKSATSILRDYDGGFEARASRTVRGFGCNRVICTKQITPLNIYLGRFKCINFSGGRSTEGYAVDGDTQKISLGFIPGFRGSLKRRRNNSRRVMQMFMHTYARAAAAENVGHCVSAIRNAVRRPWIGRAAGSREKSEQKNDE